MNGAGTPDVTEQAFVAAGVVPSLFAEAARLTRIDHGDLSVCRHIVLQHGVGLVLVPDVVVGIPVVTVSMQQLRFQSLPRSLGHRHHGDRKLSSPAPYRAEK